MNESRPKIKYSKSDLINWESEEIEEDFDDDTRNLRNAPNVWRDREMEIESPAPYCECPNQCNSAQTQHYAGMGVWIPAKNETSFFGLDRSEPCLNPFYQELQDYYKKTDLDYQKSFNDRLNKRVKEIMNNYPRHFYMQDGYEE